MIAARAFAKVNWSLAIMGRRQDGYHLLDMLMQSVSLHDTLTFEQQREMQFCQDGVAGWDDKNLVCRAADLLRQEYGAKDGVRIELRKDIPAMAGLGGGSADAAATLLALNKLWRLGLSPSELAQVGLRLGADVPFCLTGGLSRVRGIGEDIVPIRPMPSMGLLLVMPRDGLSTAQVFRGYDDCPAANHTDNALAAHALTHGDYAALSTAAHNDLTEPAMAQNHGVADALAALEEAGTLFARMSGSGACCFGVFRDMDAACTALKRRFDRVWAVRTVPQGVELGD